MPLQPWMKLLSTDDHLIEHPRLWTDRLPKKYHEEGPRIIEMPAGGDEGLLPVPGTANHRRAEAKAPAEVWTYEDRIYPYISTRGSCRRSGRVRGSSSSPPRRVCSPARLRRQPPLPWARDLAGSAAASRTAETPRSSSRGPCSHLLRGERP